jgi:SNF2 family DNA or RNA helicase
MNRSNMWQYQATAVEHIANNPLAGLFLDMGLGKTVSTLTAITELIELMEVCKILIVAPKRVASSVWSAEIDKWDHLQHLSISKVIGSDLQRRAALAVKADIHIISKDNIAWLCGLFGGSMLPFDMLVIDESTAFKNPSSIRFKALKKVLPSFNRVVILTGTPAPNGLVDIWSQIFLLDMGDRLGKTFGYYKAVYFNAASRSGDVVHKYAIVPGCTKLIYDKISDICISMKATDYLDMPDLVNNYIELEMSPAQAKRYKDFEKEKVLELIEQTDTEGGVITAVNAAALSTKLLQYANGAIYDEDRNVHEVHQIKLDAVEEIVENANGTPVLIAYAYKHDKDRMMAKLKKYKPVILDTDQHIKDWNAGKIQVLIMHPASGGHGLNLQGGGNIVVWFGLTWNLEFYQQLITRIYRQGQKAKQVFVHHLIVKGTREVDVVKSLDGKNTTQAGLMDSVKAMIKEYKEIFN